MRGIGALRAEVLDRLDQAAAEVHGPQSIDSDARGQRILRIEQPAREPESIAWELRLPWEHALEAARRDRPAMLVVHTTFQQIRLPRRRRVPHHHDLGRGGGELIDALARGGEFSAGRFDVRVVRCDEFGQFALACSAVR